MAKKSVGEQLGEFYAEWSRKLDIVKDRNQSLNTRLAALHWIERQIGERLSEATDIEALVAQLDD